MKTLDIIRHAKSSWSFQSLDDYSRPLGKRGRKDVIKMGSYFQQNQIKVPKKIITSPASRAFYTALFLADAWGYEEDAIQLEAQLYHADEEEIIEIIQEHDEVDHLAVVGHNPGFTGLINSLSKHHISNLPTCGVVRLKFNTEEWDEISPSREVESFHFFPKLI